MRVSFRCQRVFITLERLRGSRRKRGGPRIHLDGSSKGCEEADGLRESPRKWLRRILVRRGLYLLTRGVVCQGIFIFLRRMRGATGTPQDVEGAQVGFEEEEGSHILRRAVRG